MAMPWSKAKAAAIRADATGAELERLNRLFNACFRIQREACEAAGRHIPLVVENVKGAQPWVGRARWSFGSFFLWGDVPALMPAAMGRKNTGGSWFNIAHNTASGCANNPVSVPAGLKVPGFRFDGSGKSFQSASVAETGIKAPGMNWSDQPKRGQDFTRLAEKRAVAEGRKGAGAGAAWFDGNLCQLSSKSPSRKFASAMIAKIPEPLSRHVARVYHPMSAEAAS